MKRPKTQSLFARPYTDALLCVTLCIVLFGCGQTSRIKGITTDVSGAELPGVVIRVVGTAHEGFSNANGAYSFRSLPGELELEISKTGYAPVHRSITAPSLGVFNMDPIQLWPLPPAEGVYTFYRYHYEATERPRANRYLVENEGIAFGTPVEPGIVIPYADPKSNPELNPPRLIAHRMPVYDARFCRLRKVKATAAQSTSVKAKDNKNKKLSYTEDVWVADESIPLISTPLDEPERLLMELCPTMPLEPGAYAIHWGALDGYDSIDHRAFLFSVIEENEEEDKENEEGTDDEGTQEKDGAPKKQ